MAILKGGFGGGFSGLVGNAVIVQMEGKQVLRSRPGKRGKNGWSERQKMNWKRFSTVSAFWRQFRNTPIQKIWKSAEDSKRGLNLFIKANMPAYGPGGELVDPERLHFSAGRLPLPHKFTAVRDSVDPEKVVVSWQDDPGSGIAKPKDELMMMISNEGKFKGPIATGVFRKQQTAVIQLPAGIGAVQGIYLFFGSEERGMYSADQYFGI